MRAYINDVGTGQFVHGPIRHEVTRDFLRERGFEDRAMSEGPQRITGQGLRELEIVNFLIKCGISVSHILVFVDPLIEDVVDRIEVEFFGST